MKKYTALFLAIFLLFSLCACGETPDVDSGKLRIVTTIFPEYDWVRQILGDRADEAEVTMLLDSGVDLHSFQPTADDIITLGTCDVFIYVGGESDEWVEDALAQAVNKDMTVIKLMELLGTAVKEEETVEGMEAEEEEEGEAEYDEHVWLSLRNAAVCCEKIAAALAEKDSANAELYKANAAAYIEKLHSLDAEYQSAVEGASKDTLLFADRFPFRYMTEDYGLRYYAAFSGCSAESEADFETVVFLADKLTELSLPCVLTLDGSDGKIAATVVQTAKADVPVRSMNSMQSITAAAGADYLRIMEENLETLKAALG